MCIFMMTCGPTYCILPEGSTKCVPEYLQHFSTICNQIRWENLMPKEIPTCTFSENIQYW